MRMGGSPKGPQRRVPLVTHTHALFAGQSHSIPDNLVALLSHSRARNCSDSERVFGNTSGSAEPENPLERCPLSEGIRKQIPTGSFTARDPKPTSDALRRSRPMRTALSRPARALDF